METDRDVRARSFGAWASDYHESRPSYPATAVQWMLGDARRVAEVGAGTGKLTDRLVEHAQVDLVVTDIDERMLQLVADRHPRVPVHVGGASTLPCGDSTLDAVLVADAWHWFPKEQTQAELARVLRRGGWLSCVWNDPATSTPEWQWDAMGLRPDVAIHVRELEPLERLGLTRGHAVQQVFQWSWTLSPREWADYVATLSHVRTLTSGEFAAAITKAERRASDACVAACSRHVSVTFDAVCVRWLPS